MADNFQVLDGTGSARTFRSKDSGGIHTPMHLLARETGTTATLANAVTNVATQAGVAVPRAMIHINAVLTGTGVISATVQIELYNGFEWMPGPSMILSGTTSVADSDNFDNCYQQIRTKITAISGTGAALTVRAVY